MTSTDFDSISAAKRLRDAGFNADQAQAIVEGMHQAATADRNELATKADIAATKADIAALRAESKADVAALKTELKADVAAVRIEMRIYGILIVAIAGKLFGIFNAVAGVLD